MTGSEQLKKPHVVVALRERGLDPPRGVHPLSQIRKPRGDRRRAGLTDRALRFALAYLACSNAAEAARRIGISPAQAQKSGCHLLRRPEVAAFIEAERAASIERTRIDVDRVKREFARLAFVDIADFIERDEDGNIALKASEAISPDDRAAIAELKVKRGAHGVKARVKLHDKQRALDSLARLMGLYGKKPYLTIDHEAPKRDANAILRERLLRIAQSGEKTAVESMAGERMAGENLAGEKVADAKTAGEEKGGETKPSAKEEPAKSED